MTSSGAVLRARSLALGEGRGQVIRLDQPLSLWGGMDPRTGSVIDRRHPQFGAVIAGRVLVMPSGRGSSSSSSILVEAVRAGTAPTAVVLREPDPILALGAVVAAVLYGRSVPVVLLDDEGYAAVAAASLAAVEATKDGATVRVVS